MDVQVLERAEDDCKLFEDIAEPVKTNREKKIQLYTVHIYHLHACVIGSHFRKEIRRKTLTYDKPYYNNKSVRYVMMSANKAVFIHYTKVYMLLLALKVLVIYLADDGRKRHTDLKDMRSSTTRR